jgi:hypothetical protein
MKRKSNSADTALTGEAFDALPADEKERIVRELESESPEKRLARSRPLTAAQRQRWQRIRRRLNARKPNKSVKIISVGLEPALVKRADAHAKRLGISRAQLVAQGLQAILGSAA